MKETFMLKTFIFYRQFTVLLCILKLLCFTLQKICNILTPKGRFPFRVFSCAGGKFLRACSKKSSTLLNFFSNPRGYFLKNQSDFTQKSRAGKILGMENGLY